MPSQIASLALGLLFFMTLLSSAGQAYQLLESAVRYPGLPEGQTIETTGYRQKANYRNYTFYISENYYSARNARFGLGPAILPISELHVALAKKAFEIVEARSGISGLTFSYGGTFNLSQFPVADYRQQMPLSDQIADKKIYIDFETTGFWMIGGTGSPVTSTSSGSDAGGAYIWINLYSTDFMHPLAFRPVMFLVHEILHSLGLGHSATPGAWLSYNNVSSQALSADDQFGLKQIFYDATPTTSVTVQVKHNGQNAKALEVAFIDIVTGRSYLQLTNASGLVSSRGIPAGSYWLAAKEINESISGPCFSDKETGFLASFYQSDSASTNVPASATPITLVAGVPQSVTLTLVSGTKNFECGSGFPSVHSSLTFPRTALHLTDMTQESFRPGTEGFILVENELSTIARQGSLKVPVTNVNSGYHANISVSVLGASPVIKLVGPVANPSGYESNWAVTSAVRVPPDAPPGIYAGVCVSGGEYGLIPSLIEVQEFGKYINYNAELLSELKDSFSYDYTNYEFGANVGKHDRNNPGGPTHFDKVVNLPSSLFLLALGFALFAVAVALLNRRTKWPRAAFTFSVVFLTAVNCAKKKGEEVSTAISDPGPIDVYDERFMGSWTSGKWRSISETNEPQSRDHHSAVWTGTEMIVWGGLETIKPFLNTGGRYNPASDTWSSLSTTGAPSARGYHTAVWTGTEMIVWGGRNLDGAFNSGARYNPTTDTWTATSTTNAPSPRSHHTAIWTGSKMLIWGGREGGQNFNDGGIYDPANDTWTAFPVSGGPSARFNHRAVWTGTEMIVFGGDQLTGKLGDGARYNPTSGLWNSLSVTGGPEPRSLHTMIYGGGKILVFGGISDTDYHGSAYLYDIATEVWSDVFLSGTSRAVFGMPGVWADDRFILSGGVSYDPVLGLASAADMTYELIPGGQMIEQDVAYYNNPRTAHTVVWTGSKMLMWGGSGMSHFYGSYNRLGRGAAYTK